VTQRVESSVSSRKPRSLILRGIYLILGLVCLVFLAFSWLPFIPTFDFVILAAFFFSRSSDRFHTWLVTHPVFGRIISGYRGGLTLRMKVVATIGILASLAFSGLVLTDNRIVRTIIGLVGIYAVWFVWSRPRKTTEVGG
jgi:uncharacterized membrane protein YbaN (DUF454 family)